MFQFFFSEYTPNTNILKHAVCGQGDLSRGLKECAIEKLDFQKNLFLLFDSSYANLKAVNNYLAISRF